VRRSTSDDILDQFTGRLKFCTRWLHLSETRGYLYRTTTMDGLQGCVGCTGRLNQNFWIPKKVGRIAFVFTTAPNGGDASTMVREYSFLDFTREARDFAGIAAYQNGERSWYWHVILDWKD